MAQDKQALLKNIPAVDRLLLSPELTGLMSDYPRERVLKAVHLVLADIRQQILIGTDTRETPDLSMDTLARLIAEKVLLISKPSLKSLINATGVVVHTNLGRSILPDMALNSIKAIAGGYSNLEYNLDQGKRGSRYSHVEEILKDLTGAEGALVVNNNAGAVLIALETMAKGREVIVSRGQLVEIGGSFRVPDVMRKSGAKMVEVGTTNKTHLRDYEEVIGPETGLLLKVHTSNFHMVGFTQEVPVKELAGLGKQYGVPVMEDLGSGCLVDFSEFGLTREPTVQEAMGQGADLVTFSGDKLLGGPQAGIILGRRDLIEAIRQNPLNRALRIDKLTLAALETVLNLYRDPRRAIMEIPTLKMICEPYVDLTKKAGRLKRMLGKTMTRNFSIQLEDGISKVGGGALPLLELKSRILCLVPGKMTAQALEEKLRAYDPPVIARVERERVLLDVRTIQDNELKIVAQIIKDLAAAS
jgi:L-seryl-tRNA(Ser) seleniumtransferase